LRDFLDTEDVVPAGNPSTQASRDVFGLGAAFEDVRVDALAE
jgi:hypothetical protein